MAKRGKRRGVSFGTILVVLLLLSAGTMGGYIFTRISGDTDQIVIDPALLSEPLSLFAREIIDTEPVTRPETGTGDDNAGATEPPPLATATATAAPTPAPNRTLRLSAVGQIAVGAELRAAAGNDGLSFSDMFAPVQSALSGADLSIATLRTTLTENASAYEAYRAPSALVSGLKSAGVNLFNLSTDRLLDFGASGLSATRDVLEALQASPAGIYRTAEERQNLSVADMGGVKVAVLPYTAAISDAGKKAATDAEISTATRLLGAQAAAADIMAVKEKGADIVIVLAHWGNRSDTKASSETRSLAETMAAAGADVILGTGPTSVHEIERIQNGDRETLVAYSLGNFLVDDSRDTANIVGIVLQLEMEWDGAARKATLQSATYTPTWIMRWRDTGGVNRYRVVPAGADSIPENMTDSVYVNMTKAFQSLANRLGAEAAQPKSE